MNNNFYLVFFLGLLVGVAVISFVNNYEDSNLITNETLIESIDTAYSLGLQSGIYQTSLNSIQNGVMPIFIDSTGAFFTNESIGDPELSSVNMDEVCAFLDLNNIQEVK